MLRESGEGLITLSSSSLGSGFQSVGFDPFGRQVTLTEVT